MSSFEDPPSSFEDPPPHDEEEVDGVPVLAEVRPVPEVVEASASRLPVLRAPAVQAAAAAATGFLAGAATFALVRRSAARRLAAAAREPVLGGRRPGLDMLPIVRSQTYIVDVHVIGRPPRD